MGRPNDEYDAPKKEQKTPIPKTHGNRIVIFLPTFSQGIHAVRGKNAKRETRKNNDPTA
jgi:hypothetical protein